jgi:hypothetical protein
MPSHPWTDSDPNRGDFDAELASIDSRYVETHGGDPDARLRIGSPTARGQKPGAVVAELLRVAERLGRLIVLT